MPTCSSQPRLVLLLSGMGALALYSTFVLGHGSVYGLVPEFLLNAEANIPTFFSAPNLILCSVLLMLVATFTARSGRCFIGSWILLGIGALFVGVDEAAGPGSTPLSTAPRRCSRWQQ